MFVAFAIMKRRPRNRQLTIHQLVIAPETNCSCISSDIKPMQVEAYTMGNRRKMSYTRLLYREEKSCRRPSLPYESNLRVGLDEVNTLLDVLLEVTKAGLEELLLVGVDLANGEDLLNTVGAELDLGGEEVNTLVLVERAVDESGLNDTLLTLGGLQEGLSHASTSHGHGEGGRASTILGLDNLITTELDAVDELIAGLTLNAGVAGLGEKRDNGHTGVTTDDSDGLVGGVGLLDLGDEARGTDNVKGGDTEETLGVVDTLGLEDLRDDGDGGVDLIAISAR